MPVTSLMMALTLARVAGATEALAAPAQSGLVAIRAARVLLSDGRSVDHGVILIDDRVIRAVGAGVEIPADASIIEHAGTASAGMIALHAYDGGPSEFLDDTRTVLDAADVAYAFDPTHTDFERALHAGITTLVLTPLPASLVPGMTAVVKTSGARVLKRTAQLAVGLSERSLSANRFPTSLAGAMDELDRLFTKRDGAFGKAASGKLPVLFDVESKSDVMRARDLAARHKLTGALFGAVWAGELAADLKGSGLAVICGPFGPGQDRRDLRAVVALADAGVPFGFALESPWADPAGLRFSAALCTKAGLAPHAAWRSLSSEAAEIAGVADKVGRLERGFDADIVLWSGDPLDLTSAVDAVFVDGQRVFEAQR
jgi:imidazolonepropionase-like amidohydrolase